MRIIERNPLENAGVIDRKCIYHDYDIVHRVFRGLPRGGTLEAIRPECIIVLADRCFVFLRAGRSKL